MPWYISFMDTNKWLKCAVILLLAVAVVSPAMAQNRDSRLLGQDWRWQDARQPAAQSLRLGTDEQFLQLDFQQQSGLGSGEWRGLNITAPAIQSAVEFTYRDETAGVTGTATVEQIYSPDLVQRQRQELRLGLDSFDWVDDDISSMVYVIASRFSDVRDGIKIYPGLQLMGKEFTTELDIDLSGDTMLYFKYRW